jgi:hypothetical protein
LFSNSPEISSRARITLQFAIEGLLFGVLLALCAWPIIAAAGAISQIL